MLYPKQFEKKVWGSVWHVFSSEKAAVSILELESGYCCSKHLHLERANLFISVSAELVIEEWGKDETIILSRIHPGGIHLVPSTILHRFNVVQSGCMIEVYWSDIPNGTVRHDDIQRVEEGGNIDVRDFL